jgi:hypothetical protein
LQQGGDVQTSVGIPAELIHFAQSMIQKNVATCIKDTTVHLKITGWYQMLFGSYNISLLFHKI